MVVWEYSANKFFGTLQMFSGGVLLSSASSAVEYRVEAREMKARAELESYRAAVDLLGFSPVLVNYAIESQLKEIGILCPLFRSLADLPTRDVNYWPFWVNGCT